MTHKTPVCAKTMLCTWLCSGSAECKENASSNLARETHAIRHITIIEHRSSQSTLRSTQAVTHPSQGSWLHASLRGVGALPCVTAAVPLQASMILSHCNSCPSVRGGRRPDFNINLQPWERMKACDMDMCVMHVHGGFIYLLFIIKCIKG